MNDQRISSLIGASSGLVHSAWQYNIVSISGNKISIGNILLALVVFLMGVWYAKKLQRKLKVYLSKKFQADQDAANALENIISYLFLIIFVTIILQVANIPLSTFAFIGGALAIGVGLGAQNLINNFISSLIIMVERPVKIGDHVQIDGISGTVTAVGARCVTIQTSKLSDVLIPNSKLIQENLTNWSLSDDLIKTTITVKFYKNIYCKMGKELAGVTPTGLKITSSENHHHSPQEILQKLQQIITSFPEAIAEKRPEIYFNGLDEWYYNYQITFVYDSKQSEKLSYLKSKINLALVQEFSIEDLIIEYS